MTAIRLLTAVVLFAAWAPPVLAQAPSPEPRWKWYEYDTGRKLRVNLYLFYSNTCPHCPPALEFARDLEARKPYVRVLAYEVTGDEANRQLYRDMAAAMNRAAGTTLAFFYCKVHYFGYVSYDHTGRAIERSLDNWYEVLSRPRPAAERTARFLTPPPVPFGNPDLPPLPDPDEMPAAEPVAETVHVPGWGDVPAADLSLPVLTLVLAGCDAVNPCAFFVLITLLGILAHGRSRGRMLLIGGLFVFFSGAMYFLFMAAWLNLFVLIGHMKAITAAAGVVAAAAAVMNVKDFFLFRVGPTLSIPDAAKPGLFRRMGRLVGATRVTAVLAGTAGLAFATNLYELLCTAGFPMVYTRVLTLHDLPPAGYYLYLAAYNLIYVSPMALIVTGFAFTLGSRKLTEYQGRVLKLLSGMMLLALAFALLAKPDVLYSAAGAAGVLGAAVGGTTAIVLTERCIRNRHPVTESAPVPSAG